MHRTGIGRGRGYTPPPQRSPGAPLVLWAQIRQTCVGHRRGTPPWSRGAVARLGTNRRRLGRRASSGTIVEARWRRAGVRRHQGPGVRESRRRGKTRRRRELGRPLVRVPRSPLHPRRHDGRHQRPGQRRDRRVRRGRPQRSTIHPRRRACNRRKTLSGRRQRGNKWRSSMTYRRGKL